MRTSIRLRLLILMLVPAVTLLAFSGLQLTSTLELSRQARQFEQVVEVADAQYGLVHALQIERTRTLEAFHLGADGAMDMTGAELQQARAATDASLTTLRSVAETSFLVGQDGALRSAHDMAVAAVRQVTDARAQVDAGDVSDPEVQVAYQQPIDALLSIDDEVATTSGSPAAIQRRLQVGAAVARLKAAALDRGDTVLLAVAGSIDPQVAGRRVASLADQQALWVDVLGRLTAGEESAAIDALAAIDPQDVTSQTISGLAEDTLGTVQDIAAANRAVAGELLALEGEVASTSLAEVAETSAATTRRTAMVGGAAVAALLFTLYLLFSLTRGIVDPLRRLTAVAGRMAESLPARVGAVARGEEVPEDADATLGPDLLQRRDELGNLARALGSATDQATQVAVEQARTRHGVAQTISDVARREQRLVERQLSLLEVMESREEDPEQLSQLFALDHMATRMRRNAENLLLLSAGQMPGTGETEPLALVDVVRSAAAETEDYARVDVRVGLPLDVVGYAATPLAHLLAELIENATTFSPPQSRVSVTTQRESAGVTVAVLDRGLGMSPEDLEDARARLNAPPLLEAAESRRLGLYVVGLLAQRLGVTVDMGPGEGGGLAVHVWLPESLFTKPLEATAGPAALAGWVAATPPAEPALHAEAPPTSPSPDVPADAAHDPEPGFRPPALEDATPDAFSVMQGLLDATPSAPPPLPDDVAPAAGPQLPTRAHASEAPAPPAEGANLSMARASAGHTVDLDPSQVSQLMRSFSDDLNFGLADPPASAAPAPAAQPAPVAAPVAETAQPHADASAAQAHQLASPAPGGAPPTPAASPTSNVRRSGSASSWSTPFPTKGGPR